MKFLLVVVMCSSVMQVCTPEMRLDYYDSWFDCSSAGYLAAFDFNQNLGKSRVDAEKVLVNFKCEMVGTI